MSLNNIDKKILLSLIKNSRKSISRISKELHLTREIVIYRISKLESAGIITNHIARINQALFCSGIALMTCKLIRFNETRFKEIIIHIQNMHSINWCIETCGTYDIAFTILYNNSRDLAESITEVSNHIGANLKEHEITLYIEEYKFDRSGLITEKKEQYNKNKSIEFKNIKMNLDELDIKLLSILAKNCRTKNVEISKKLKISEDIVRLRIKNLEKKEIILGYTVSLDIEKLGFEAYQAGFKIEHLNKETINKIKYYSQTNPYIIFCVRTSGKYNIVVNITAKSRLHFNEIIKDIRNNLPEIIDFEFLLNMKTHKEIFIPEKN